MTTIYTADGFRPVEAESMQEAANIFADRLARRKYGKNAVSHTNQNSWSRDGLMGEYQAFVGRYDRQSRSSTGDNVWITVQVK